VDILKPVCYAAPHEKTSPRFCQFFAEGCGGRVVVLKENQRKTVMLYPGPFAFFGTPFVWKSFKQAIHEGRTWYYGDHAYFGRWQYFRITKNDFQCNGTGTAGPARFSQFGLQIKPWRKSGSKVLVCPPETTYAKLRGFSAQKWIAHVYEALKGLTDRPIEVRKHPNLHDKKESMQPLKKALNDTWCMVTYNSNAAVEALIEGVPVIATGKCAASRMGLNDINQVENPLMPPDREQWAWNLAANQFTYTEIRNGIAWRALNEI
jgi:hypothetical protein